MAAALFTAELGSEAGAIEVASGGTSALDGQPASEGSRAVAAGDGIDLSSHRARRLTAERVRDADLVFVMEPAHRAAVLALGAAGERVHLLSDWPQPGEPDLPVSDPFGASREAYEECWRRIRHHVRRIVPHVRREVRARSTP